MASDEKLVMTCEICESELIALHGFFITCPNCPEQNESCQADEKINSDKGLIQITKEGKLEPI